MHAFDFWGWLPVFAVLALAALLTATSRLFRAIAWETIAHPFTHSVIELREGEVVVRRGLGKGSGPAGAAESRPAVRAAR